MHVVVKNHESLVDTLTVTTGPVDVSDAAMLTVDLIAHALGGTAPGIDAQLQSSDNLEDWIDVGSPVNLAAVWITIAAFVCSSTPWGRYVRFEITLSGGTPKAVYSLWLSTFASS